MKENLSLKIDIINELKEEFVPSKKNIKEWLRRSMEFINDDIDLRRKSFEVSYKIISSDCMRGINNKFRKKNMATNVLSFPSGYEEMMHLEEIDRHHLGDVIVCAEFVGSEAKSMNRDQMFHWCHICVHGFLHLFDYDHTIEKHAEKMQLMETQICKSLDFSDPYK
tara:strand:+ start:264 stop:761 length:498 start_codon:yes stop_codon:yes gene_type:complete